MVVATAQIKAAQAGVLADAGGSKTWENDPLETALRTWASWTSQYKAKRFPTWTNAVRLVALIPLSSAFV